MESVEYSEVPIIEKPLHQPDLNELADVLREGLRGRFAEVQVSAAPCPDLTRAPYHLAAPGLCGEPVLVEVGGPAYLLPTPRRDRLYELAALVRRQRQRPGLLAGAGAGPWPHVGTNCEGIINMFVSADAVRQESRTVAVQPRGAPKGGSGGRLRLLPPTETRCALLGNYLLSDGAPGTVIKVVAKNRVCETNFVTAMREALTEHYGEQIVGLGGVMVLREGRAWHHVMADFADAPLRSDAAVDKWLHYFDLPAPLTHYGTLVTGDMGLDLRLQHFHGWNGAEGEGGAGGHYHYDLSPAQAHYEALLVPAGSVLRVDAPANTHHIGRD